MNFWNNKTVLVAGGAGFVGRHLTRSLLAGGAKVDVIDDFSTGQETFPDQIAVHRHDIAKGGPFPKADVIFNLASPASPVHYQRDPLQTWKTNVLGTLHLLEHAQSCGATLMHASTSETYGDPLSHPQVETDWGNVNPIGPRACYDESKRAAETLLMDAARMTDADVRIARIFNTYGPGMDLGDGRAVPNFIAQARAGQPITIHGDGTQTRSFCYISDTVDGLLRLASIPDAKGEVVNIGNPAEMTVADLANHIKVAVGGNSPLVFHPRLIDDPTRRCPNIDKAKRILGWEPKVSLKDGISKTLAV